MIDTQKDNIADMNPLVSIIVPVYKVEAYLERCVESIIAQTYRNIEVILVDDGSPDRCGKMCDEYAEKYQVIQVLHQNNQGQAAARNKAAKLAKGEYILFVDSDDYITNDHVEYLVFLRDQYGADVAIGGFRYQYEGEPQQERPAQDNVIVMNTSETLSNMNYGKGYGATPWAKLFSRKVVLENPFPEGQIYEDLATMYKLIGEAKRVVFGNRIIYYWVQRANSTTRLQFDERQLFGIKAAESQLTYVQERYPEVVPAAKARYTAKVIELIGIAMRSNNRRAIFNQLKSKMKYSSSFMKNKNVRKSQKIRCFAVILGYLPSVFFFGIHEKLKEKML